MFFASAAALAGLLHAGTASADARTEARRHFKAGMSLVEKKKFAEGIIELEKAYEILPHPNVAFNIAQAQAELGNLDLAIRAYKTYLKADPPDRADVEKIVQSLQDKLAAQRAADQPGDKPADKPGDKPADKPGDKPADKPGDKPGDKPADQPGDKPADKPGDKPADKPGDKPADKPADVAKKADVSAIVGQARTEDIYQETVVTASRGAQSPLDSPNSTTIITRQDIELSGITRIPELLRRVAGIDVMQITGGDTNVSMRGFNSRLANKLLVLVNGRSVFNDILGSTFWETLTIDVDQIERIEVVRGPGSALYGANAFAGVVNIITFAPGEGRKGGVRAGYGDHNQAYGSAWISGREGDFAYRANVGYTRYPRWTREIGKDRIDLSVGDFDQNLGAENLRADIRLSQRFNKTTELNVGGGYSRVALNVYGIGPFNDYRLRGDTADATIDLKTKYVNARVYYTRLDVRSGSNYQYLGHTLYEARPQQNVLFGEVEYVGNFNLPKALAHEIHAGLSYRMKNVSWSYLQDDLPIEHHGGLFLQDTIKIGDKLNLVASGRVDYVPYLRRIVGSPRGSIVIKPTDRQAIRVSGSTAFRTPTFLEAYLALPVQLPLPGVEVLSATKREDIADFKVQPEQVTTAEASYLNQQSDYFEFEVTAYYNRVSNLVQLAPIRFGSLSSKNAGLGGYDPTTQRYTAAFGGWNNRCDIFNVFGGEVGARAYPVEGLDLFANYAINYSTQQIPDDCTVPKALLEQQADQRTSRHKFNVGVQLRTKFGLNGEITFHYQSGQQWAEQIATLSGIEYRSFQIPGYTLLNGRIGFRFFRNKLEASAVVFNALSGVGAEPPQMHPFGNRVGRRIMGFLAYYL